MGTHLDGLQGAVILVLAVVGAVVHGAFDALVGGMIHKKLLLRERIWLIAGNSVRRDMKTMYPTLRRKKSPEKRTASPAMGMRSTQMPSSSVAKLK